LRAQVNGNLRTKVVRRAGPSEELKEGCQSKSWQVKERSKGVQGDTLSRVIMEEKIKWKGLGDSVRGGVDEIPGLLSLVERYHRL